jgi:RNA polymerase primary sigma factor
MLVAAPQAPEDQRQELETRRSEGYKATQRMIEANCHLVVAATKRYKYSERHKFSDQALIDVIQEGNLGLMRAVDKFDGSKGFRFSTYAEWWIGKGITKGIAETVSLIEKSVDRRAQIYELTKLQDEYYQKQQILTDEIILEELDITQSVLDSIRETMRAEENLVYLDEPVGEGSNGAVGDLMADPNLPDPSLVATNKSTADQIIAWELKGGLNRRELSVQLRRSGFVGGVPETLQEIGTSFGLRWQQVQQISNRATAKATQYSKPWR